MIEMVEVTCPLCGADGYRELFKTHDRLNADDPAMYTVVQCCACNLRYINPRPAAKYIPDLYPDEYYNPDASPAALLEEKKFINEQKYRCFSTLTEENGRILDVGCQKGEFLAYMKQEEWEVRGVEFNNRAPNLYDLPIHYGSMETAELPEEYFDVITYWAVLEHIPEVSLELERAVRVLRPGGLLVLLTTNFNSLAARFLKLDDIPRHLVLFDKSTLKKLVSKHGCKTEKIFTSDKIFRMSANCVLRYSIARWIKHDTESFYRELFRVMYEPARNTAGRLERFRALGPVRVSLLLADRIMGYVLDKLSLMLDCYGIAVIVARKK